MTAWPPTDAVRGSVVHAYWAGRTIPEIMAEFELTDHYVRAILYDAGGRIPLSHTSDETVARIWALAQDGASHTEITRTTSAKYTTIFMVAPGTAWAVGGGGDASVHRKAKMALEAMD